MKKSITILMIFSLFMLLSGCTSSVDHFDYEKHEQIAREALVENINNASIDDVGASHPFGDAVKPENYYYVWSDCPQRDIKWLRTLRDGKKQLVRVEFYATDDSRLWVGDVTTNEKDNELLKLNSNHIFTSGVMPVMILANKWNHRNDILENKDGKFKVLSVADSIDSEFVRNLEAQQAS